MKPKFFRRPANFRKWLEQNHDKKKELLVGYHKVASGKPSITWPESVDQALCFGWIDGVRRSIDDESYSVRFTPRQEKSHWSAVNLRRYATLNKSGLVQPAGKKAFAKMDKKNTKKASFEQDEVKLSKSFEARLKANKKAWAFFKSLPPSAKKPTIWWVISAKREETQQRRFDILMKSSEAGEKIPLLRIASK
ncbi:MAG: YdeI/OmpD-associated family protein [Cyclobacteriaceae bacterium]